MNAECRTKKEAGRFPASFCILHSSFCLLLAAAPAVAKPLLICTSPTADDDGIGYNGFAWTAATTALDASAGGTADTTGDLSDLPTLLRYDGLWVDLRAPGTGTLSAAETNALSAYVATGRRVVLVGANVAGYASWNRSILSLVGGTTGADLPAGTFNRVAIVPLTTGVTSVGSSSGGGAALGAAGTSLFTQRLATVWGPAANVLVLLNPNVPGDDDHARASNAAFTTNLADWAAGAARMADPDCLWNGPAAGGTWTAGANWRAGVMPAVPDTAVFATGIAGPYAVTVPSAVVTRTLAVRGDKLILSGAGKLTVGGTLSVTNAGTLTVGSAVAVAGPMTVAKGCTLAVSGNGQLDLGSTLVWSGGDLTAASGWAATGFAGGRWTGVGLTTAAAAADARHLSAVGVVGNVAGLYTSFAGQTVAAGDVLARATVYGDANLDGVVNLADYTRLDAGYLSHATGWLNGDFNYDGTIDASDYTLADNAFNQRAAAAARPTAAVATVPEPALAALGLALLGLRRRRRPRRHEGGHEGRQGQGN